jgi:hypothetical protein
LSKRVYIAKKEPLLDKSKPDAAITDPDGDDKPTPHPK